MKQILTIICAVILFHAQATPKNKKREQIEDLQIALKACLSSKDVINDTIFIYSGKEAVKVAKQVEKTKRKVEMQETKQLKSENKTEVKTDPNRLWSKAITKTITRVIVLVSIVLVSRVSKNFIGKSWII